MIPDLPQRSDSARDSAPNGHYVPDPEPPAAHMVLRVLLVCRPQGKLAEEPVSLPQDGQFACEQVAGAAAALERLQQGTPDVLLLDLTDEAGAMDELLAMRSAAPHVPIVALTRPRVDGSVSALLEGGVQEILARDEANPASIDEAIRRALARKRAEAPLREREERYRALANAIDEGIWIIDADARTTYVNQRTADMLGYAAQEILGRSLFDFMDDEGRARAEENLERRRQGIREALEYRFLRADGAELWTSVTTGPLYGARGEYMGALKLLTDVTRRKRAEEEQRAGEARKDAILNAALDSIIAFDEHGHITEFNPAAEKTFGYPPGEVLGRSIVETIVPPRLRDVQTRSILHYLHSHRSTVFGRRVESVAMRADGSEFPVELAVACIYPEGKPLFIAYLRDISKLKEAEEARAQMEQALRELSVRDELTGLLNRREMNRLLKEEVDRYKRYGRPTSLILLDVDHFKAVNDNYGHQVGDEVLKWLANVLRSNTRPLDRLTRFGGEELAIILPETAADSAHEVAERLRGLVASQPPLDEGHPSKIQVPVTLSAGVASLPGAEETPTELLAAADMALYEAKRRGRNHVVHFQELRGESEEERR